MARGQPAGTSQSRFYLIVAAEKGAAARERLTTALDAADIAAVLIVPTGETPLSAETVKPLVDAAQGKGVAALIKGDARLARTLRADGVHLGLDDETSFAEAREVFGTRYMVGVEAGQSRHDAMEAGEAGADYVAFSLERPGEDTLEDLLALVSWWSEIFEVPAVAFGASNAAEAGALAAAGADFVAIAMPQAMAAADVAAWTRDVARALQSGKTLA